MFRLVIILSVLFSCTLTFGQKEDFRTWWAAELRGELVNLIDFKVTPEIRFNDNSTQWSTFLTDVDLSTPVFKNYRIGGQYRIESIQVREQYIVNRFGVYFKARKKIKKLRLRYRGMYHWEYIGINTREGGDIPEQFHRHKISAQYYKKKWKIRPEIGVEYFFHTAPKETFYEQKYRISAGFDYKINKQINLTLSYKYQNERWVNNPLQANIIATKLTYRL